MRRKDRELIEIRDIVKIIEKAKVLHLGLFDGEYPYIVPLHYGYKYVDETIIFYMHAAQKGHTLDLIRNNPNVCIELECGIEPVSGGDVPCKYGSAYSSVIAKGKAEFVDQPVEKIKGLQSIMNHQTSREFEIDDEMASSVEVIRVTAYEITAKSRPKIAKIQF